MTGLKINFGKPHCCFQPTFQSTAAYNCENITCYKVSWDTSQSVQSILRYFTIFSGTCSENSRCGKRLQNSVWALKSSAGCLPVIALKRAQREKEKRKWAKTVFSLVLGHWQAILVYLCIFSLLARSGAAYDTALPHYFSFAKVYSLWSLNRNLLFLSLWNIFEQRGLLDLAQYFSSGQLWLSGLSKREYHTHVCISATQSLF